MKTRTISEITQNTTLIIMVSFASEEAKNRLFPKIAAYRKLGLLLAEGKKMVVVEKRGYSLKSDFIFEDIEPFLRSGDKIEYGYIERNRLLPLKRLEVA